jgi:hypothetical protein
MMMHGVANKKKSLQDVAQAHFLKYFREFVEVKSFKKKPAQCN